MVVNIPHEKYLTLLSLVSVLPCFQALAVCQIKELVKAIDAAILQNGEDREKTEQERSDALKEIGNMLHETCVISNDEVGGQCLCEV